MPVGSKLVYAPQRRVDFTLTKFEAQLVKFLSSVSRAARKRGLERISFGERHGQNILSAQLLEESGLVNRDGGHGDGSRCGAILVRARIEISMN